MRAGVAGETVPFPKAGDMILEVPKRKKGKERVSLKVVYRVQEQEMPHILPGPAPHLQTALPASWQQTASIRDRKVPKKMFLSNFFQLYML